MVKETPFVYQYSSTEINSIDMPIYSGDVGQRSNSCLQRQTQDFSQSTFLSCKEEHIEKKDD
ncbi:MAG: hypothetical protein AAFP20_23845, partial [Cyanobacteria bacterium J06614_10]